MLIFIRKQRNIQLTKTKPIGTLASSDAYDIIDDGTLNGMFNKILLSIVSISIVH